MLRLIYVVFLCLALTACTGRPSLEDSKLSSQEFNLEEYFEGETVAYGQFQDAFGTVRRRFKVGIKGTWDGDVLRLVEDFEYSDTSAEKRIWMLTKTGDQSWEGTAQGVVGIATGMESGDRFNWA